MREGILCNECYKPLTEIEIATYSIQWQFSGDMYCTQHEDRPQFVRKGEKLKKGGQKWQDSVETSAWS